MHQPGLNQPDLSGNLQSIRNHADAKTLFTLPLNDRSDEIQPRCLGCGYVLLGLTQPVCPECGRAFDPQSPKTFTWLPMFLRWKYWLPGVLLAFVGGLFLLSLFIVTGEFGAGLVLVTPFCLGAILGYGVRVRTMLLVITTLFLVGALILGVVSMQLAGAFCGLILMGVLLGPVFVGLLVGSILRSILKLTRFSQRYYLPIWLMLAIPVVVWTIETGLSNQSAAETVTTSRVTAVPIQTAWDSWMFYEQVDQPPPSLLNLIGMPRPIATVGEINEVGDVKICVYDRGRLVKQATAYQPPHRLGFDVIGQQGVEDRSARLMRGAFVFESIDAHHTRITLSTTYEPLLSARWAWRPFEQATIHALHEHVLAGVERRACSAEIALIANQQTDP